MVGQTKQQGLGLVEILVALAIGLMLMAGVIQIFVGSKQSYRTNDALAIVQENGRFAIDFVTRDLRMAGFNPAREVCGNPVDLRTENVPDGGDANRDLNGMLWGFGGLDLDEYDELLRGYMPVSHVVGYDDYEDGDWGDAPAGVKAGTDILVIHRRVSTADTRRIADDDLDEKTLTLAHPVDVAENGVVLAINSTCETAAVFTLDDGLDDATEVSYPGDLGADMKDGRLIYGVSGGIQRRVFFIKGNALYRRVGADEQLLVDGVEDMQVTYVEDTDGDGALDAYAAADGVGDWNEIRGVHVSLLVRSGEANVLPEVQSVAFNGGVVSDADRRLRRVFTTTVGLRSQMQ